MDINGIAAAYLSEMPVWREGRQAVDQVITCPAPLTAAQLAALGDGTGWTVTEGEETRRIEGMDTLREVRYTFSRSKSELQAAQEAAAGIRAELQAKLEAKEAELNQAIQDARAGLVAAPVDGEAWEKGKWYRKGDRVEHEGKNYVCEKTCKGKEPGAVGLALFWVLAGEQEPGQTLLWADIENGAVIPVGQLVTHNGETWRCLKEHGKSIIRQPSEVQTEYWEKVTG